MIPDTMYIVTNVKRNAAIIAMQEVLRCVGNLGMEVSHCHYVHVKPAAATELIIYLSNGTCNFILNYI